MEINRTHDVENGENPEKATASQILAMKVLALMGAYSMQEDRKITGQTLIETDDEGGLVVMYSTFPNGDYLCWFIELGYFRLFALVNQKMSHILKIPADRIEELQSVIDEMKDELGK